MLCGQGTAPAAATAGRVHRPGARRDPRLRALRRGHPWLHGRLADPAARSRHRPRSMLSATPCTTRSTGFRSCRRSPPPSAGCESLFAADWTTSAAHYLPDGRVPAGGSWLRNPTLAATYRRLIDAAAGLPGARHRRGARRVVAQDSWPSGRRVQSARTGHLRRAARRASHGAGHGGLGRRLRRAGHRGFRRLDRRQDRRRGARDRCCCNSCCCWTGSPLQTRHRRLRAHVVEAAKLAFADRDAYYGDSGDVPLTTLLSAEYAAERGPSSADRASTNCAPVARRCVPRAVHPHGPDSTGSSWFDGAPGGPPSAVRLAAPAIRADGRRPAAGSGRAKATPAMSTSSTAGERWSAPPRRGGWLHSSPLIPGLGFPLGTRLQMLTLQPGFPTTLTPGRRPRTTLSPSMAGSHAVEPVLAFGTPGGDQQDQWQLTFLLAHVLGGMNLQEAIDAPSFHTTALPQLLLSARAVPGGLVVEDRLGADVHRRPAAARHRVVECRPVGTRPDVRREPRPGDRRGQRGGESAGDAGVRGRPLTRRTQER